MEIPKLFQPILNEDGPQMTGPPKSKTNLREKLKLMKTSSSWSLNPELAFTKYPLT